MVHRLERHCSGTKVASSIGSSYRVIPMRKGVFFPYNHFGVWAYLRIKITAMHKTLGSTWLSLLEELRGTPMQLGSASLEEIQSLLSMQQFIHPLFEHTIPAIYLLDYTTGKYRFMSDQSFNSIGMESREHVEGGLDVITSRYHPEDLRLFNEQIFPDRMEFLSHIPPDQHHAYIFTYTYRLRDNLGSYRQLMQRNSYIRSDEAGRPLLSLGLLININHVKLPAAVTQTVEKASPIRTMAPAEPVFKKQYCLHDLHAVITIREKEILRELAEGLSSKQIAHKLHISEHTVVVHRKHMLAKTKSRNVAELLCWALRESVI